MAQWLVQLWYPLDDQSAYAFEAAGIIRRTGGVYTVNADNEDEVRAKVLAVRPDASIGDIVRGRGGT